MQCAEPIFQTLFTSYDSLIMIHQLWFAHCQKNSEGNTEILFFVAVFCSLSSFYVQNSLQLFGQIMFEKTWVCSEICNYM